MLGMLEFLGSRTQPDSPEHSPLITAGLQSRRLNEPTRSIQLKVICPQSQALSTGAPIRRHSLQAAVAPVRCLSEDLPSRFVDACRVECSPEENKPELTSLCSPVKVFMATSVDAGGYRGPITLVAHTSSRSGGTLTPLLAAPVAPLRMPSPAQYWPPPAPRTRPACEHAGP